MKNNIITAAAVAASAILLTLSCTKQEEMRGVSKGKTFTATIEQAQTKTALEYDEGKYLVNWSDGDLININGVAVYSATPDTRKSGYAEFTLVKGQEPTLPYAAVYPSSLCDPEDKSNLYFPQVQKYEAGRCNAPMVALAEDESLTFHNVCGVICFSLTGTGSVRGIELFSGSHPLWGGFTVNPDNWVATIDEDENQTGGGMGMGLGMANRHVVALDCSEEGVPLSEDKPTDFYLYLPAGEYPVNDLRVNITGTEGGEDNRTAQNSVTVERNCVYHFEWNVQFVNSASADTMIVNPPVAVEDALLPGEFSVDAYGTKVRFTRGNLYWSGSGWELEGEQFYFPTSDSYDSGLVNLLYWTENGNDSYTQAPEVFFTQKPPRMFCDGSDADRMLNIYEQGKLFVLSSEQWEYLLNREEGELFALAKVCGVNGLLLFPDNKAGIDYLPDYVYIGNNDVEFPSSSIDSETWEQMESVGVVFLPAAGMRNGNGFDAIGQAGAYLSSTFYYTEEDGENVEVLVCEDKDAGIELLPLSCAASIRLVQKIDAIPAPPAPEQVTGE